MRSRLKTTKEQQAKRNLFLSIIGIGALFLALLIFGIPFLINFSLFVEKKIDPNQNETKADAYIPSPQLDISYTATNSGVIQVGGSGQEEQSVYLYVNNEQIADVIVDDDGSFIFDDVKLKEGENEIFAKAKEDNKSSKNSDSLYINYIKDAPDLSIDSPADGQTFHGGDEKTITVSGKTREGAKVTVNGFWAVMQPDGSFRYRLSLNDGDNQIRILSEDEAGNKTEKNVKATYAP